MCIETLKGKAETVLGLSQEIHITPSMGWQEWLVPHHADEHTHCPSSWPWRPVLQKLQAAPKGLHLILQMELCQEKPGKESRAPSVLQVSSRGRLSSA